MAELEEGLLQGGVRTQFQVAEDKITKLIDEMKQLNDQQQTQNAATMSQSEINQSRVIFKMKAEKVKTELNLVDKQARGGQRGIVTKLKQNYTREVDRQKRIMRSFVNQSFENKFNRITMIKQSKATGMDTQQEQLQYFVDEHLVKVVPKEQRESFLNQSQATKHSNVQPAEVLRVKAVSIDDDVLDQDMIDLENMLIEERQKEFDQIEREAMNLNIMANQMGQMVDEQGQDLVDVQKNLDVAKGNVGEVKKELIEANSQSNNRKFYYMGGGLAICAIVIIVLIIVLIVK